MMRTRMAKVGAAAILLLGAAVAAPMGLRPKTAAAQPAPPNQVAIVMGDYYLNPSEITVKANEPIQFVTPNVGDVRHRVSVRLMGTEDRVNMETADVGQVTVYEMTFTTPGVYEMWCSFTTDGVNHREAGMVGTLTVAS